MTASRRDVLKGTGTATIAGSVLLGTSRIVQAETARLPAWRYGTGSHATDTVLMFRGNPAHTFYGTGPIPDRPRIRWQYRTAEIRNVVRGTPMTWTGTGWTGTAAKLADYIYVGSVGGYVYCFEALSGKLVWSHKGGGMFKSSVCLFDNKVYIGNTDDLLRCLDAATGRVVWTVNTGRDLDSSPVVTGGRLYIAGENGYARCLDPQTGREIWKTFMGGIGPGSVPGSNGSETTPAIADGDYYAITYDGDLFCLDTKDGRVKWKAKTHDDTDASPVVSGDLVYAAAEEKASHVYCFERSAGREVWRYSANPRGYWSTPAVAGGKLYVGGDDARLHCLDARSGKGLWMFPTGEAIWSSPAVVDDRVLFGSRDGHLYCVDAGSGREIWRLKLDGRIISSPCIVDGLIWIGTATGWFYCIGA
ncbi:MAG TPA: PQQ-binding-like beta-propeller repeat protein [Hyphomicrobiaceae bacterium]|nr:PQQ-binding-like beta-propeller repeat protein [Hyphomicrobiaceae bacterium]